MKNEESIKSRPPSPPLPRDFTGSRKICTQFIFTARRQSEKSYPRAVKFPNIPSRRSPRSNISRWRRSPSQQTRSVPPERRPSVRDLTLANIDTPRSTKIYFVSFSKNPFKTDNSPFQMAPVGNSPRAVRSSSDIRGKYYTKISGTYRMANLVGVPEECGAFLSPAFNVTADSHLPRNALSWFAYRR